MCTIQNYFKYFRISSKLDAISFSSGIFLNAKALNKWMRETFGTNPATNTSPLNLNHFHFTSNQGGINGLNFPNLMIGLKGIYSMVSTNPNWASGHADLIDENGICVFGCHLNDSPPAPIDYIDIWVLE